MNILYIGQWASDAALLGKEAPSLAAANWIRPLLAELSALGHDIRVLTHARERMFPYGHPRPGCDADIDASLPFTRLGYWNLPFLRAASLCRAYAKAARSLCPDVVLTYNLLPENLAAVRTLVARGVRWIPLVLDWYGEDLVTALAPAAGAVVLSDALCRALASRLPTLLLDGGIASRPPEAPRAGVRTLVYSGAATPLVAEVVRAVTRRDARFVITGKDPYGLLTALKDDPRVTLTGALPADRLEAVYRAADVFLAPRETGTDFARTTFPSKILAYLAYAKPIVSTWTEGLSPVYRDVLDVAPLADFPARIDHWLAAPEAERAALAARIRRFAAAHTWTLQARRIDEFLKKEAVGRRVRLL